MTVGVGFEDPATGQMYRIASPESLGWMVLLLTGELEEDEYKEVFGDDLPREDTENVVRRIL
jgi:hypothetical protein